MMRTLLNRAAIEAQAARERWLFFVVLAVLAVVSLVAMVLMAR